MHMNVLIFSEKPFLAIQHRTVKKTRFKIGTGTAEKMAIF